MAKRKLDSLNTLCSAARIFEQRFTCPVCLEQNIRPNYLLDKPLVIEYKQEDKTNITTIKDACMDCCRICSTCRTIFLDTSRQTYLINWLTGNASGIHNKNTYLL